VLRRRQAVTIAAMVAGSALLAVSLRIEPGSSAFYPTTFLLGGVWVLGSLGSGPLHLGREIRATGAGRPVWSAIGTGLLLAAVFIVGGLVVREIPLLRDYVGDIVAYADQGVTWLIALVALANGVAEELFFRGAAYAAIPYRPVLFTTLLYAGVTMATGNLMLVLAALILGLVVGLQRRASGGVLAPILTHVTWSQTMLVALPLLFA
jgi:uncharacterized protein